MGDFLLTTRQAAELLGIHASSVKRWCNADLLACEQTEGGHRRIRLHELLRFARTENHPCILFDFAPDEAAVWEGIEAARRGEGFGRLVGLLYGWLELSERERPERLLLFLLEMGFAPEQVFDELLGPVMHRVGASWADGVLTVGDEHRMTQALRDALLMAYISRRARRAPRQTTNEAAGTAIVGCAPGDDHEMGALMARFLLGERGWKVIYLGANVPVEDFVIQQVRHEASLIAIAMTPPHGPAEALAHVRTLARLYEPSHPCRLVLGGRLLGGLSPELPETPFPEVSAFDSMLAFSDWLDQLVHVSIPPKALACALSDLPLLLPRTCAAGL